MNKRMSIMAHAQPSLPFFAFPRTVYLRTVIPDVSNEPTARFAETSPTSIASSKNDERPKPCGVVYANASSLAPLCMQCFRCSQSIDEMV